MSAGAKRRQLARSGHSGAVHGAKDISLTLGVGASWEFHPPWPHWVNKGTLNFSYDHLRIDYQDFRDDLIAAPTAEDQPLYTLDANVMQFFISFWY